MKHILTALTLIVFMAWLLPLGIYIKPSQEKIACDGQRAICLCHVGLHKAANKPMEPGISLKGQTASSQKEEAHGGAAGHYFVSAKVIVSQGLQVASAFENQYLCYKNPYLASLDHVPKA